MGIYLLAKENHIVVKAGEDREDSVNFPDNMKLRDDLINSLDGLQKSAIVFNVSGVSKKLIEIKVEELSSRIKWVAIGSGLGGAVPVPGLSAIVDITLVMRELSFQKKQLQINDNAIKGHKKNFGSEFDQRMDRRLTSNAKKFFIAFDSLGSVVTKQMLASEAVELAMNAVPVVGSIAGGALSAAVTSCTLYAALMAHKDIALAMLEIVNELNIEKGFEKKKI